MKFIVLFFFSAISFAQDFSVSDNINTLLIEYDSLKKTNLIDCNVECIEYTFFLEPVSNKIHRNQLRFLYMKYADFDAIERDDKTVVFEVDKKFIKRNKSRILDLKEMNKMDRVELIKLLLDTEHIFILDKNDKSNRSGLMARQVKYLHLGSE